MKNSCHITNTIFFKHFCHMDKWGLHPVTSFKFWWAISNMYMNNLTWIIPNALHIATEHIGGNNFYVPDQLMELHGVTGPFLSRNSYKFKKFVNFELNPKRNLFCSHMESEIILKGNQNWHLNKYVNINNLEKKQFVKYKLSK